jgi:hypothetical protein
VAAKVNVGGGYVGEEGGDGDGPMEPCKAGREDAAFWRSVRGGRSVFRDLFFGVAQLAWSTVGGQLGF